jgi:hypothetical protein
VPKPLHQVTGSIYPTAVARQRSLLVYTPFLTCLNPAMCNVAPRDSPPTTWSSWLQYVREGRADLPENALFQCRTGHDPASLQCSQCLPGFFVNGFLCDACPATASYVGPLIVCVAALVYLAIVMRQSVQVANNAFRRISDHNVSSGLLPDLLISPRRGGDPDDRSRPQSPLSDGNGPPPSRPASPGAVPSLESMDAIALERQNSRRVSFVSVRPAETGRSAENVASTYLNLAIFFFQVRRGLC